mmetsp:Transcript_62471/g.135613  ORF Transcript_62471/g.135613 Transcript_62471/m.135613 type:complete len:555 (+) Transcript_62471:76-1740(+)
MGFGTSKFDSGKFVAVVEGGLANRYDIVKQLGAGAQGAVYLVKAKSSGVECVAKESHDMTDEGEEAFQKEFQTMKKLRHPNCAKVIEMLVGKEHIRDGVMKKQLYVISELARGSDLYSFVQKKLAYSSSLTEEWIAKVFVQAMRGVAFMHENGIVHNDLKPDNILMIDDFSSWSPEKVPSVVINDFGCATLDRDFFFRCGDPRYFSPQTWPVWQLLQEGKHDDYDKLDAKADVWSMGMTLYELLSGGRLPFLYEPCELEEILSDNGRHEKLRDAVLHEELSFDCCSEISTDAQSLVRDMLTKDLNRRPSAKEALEHKWFNIKGTKIKEDLISRLEFKATKGIAHRILLNAMATKLQRDHYDSCLQKFGQIDCDSNGFITEEEFRGVLSSRESNRMDEETLGRVFREADIDNDKRLDFNEFVAMTFDWKSLDKTTLDDSLKSLIDGLDQDGDGRLQESELAKLLDGAVSRRELRELFKRIDVNCDGSLSPQELHNFLFNSQTDEELDRFMVTPESATTGRDEGAGVLCGTALPIAGCLCLSLHGLGKLGLLRALM